VVRFSHHVLHRLRRRAQPLPHRRRPLRPHHQLPRVRPTLVQPHHRPLHPTRQHRTPGQPAEGQPLRLRRRRPHQLRRPMRAISHIPQHRRVHLLGELP